MAPYFNPQSRPETVLKRAEELTKVGQSVTALETLYDALTNRHLRGANAANTEPYMRKFVELSIEHRRGKQLKDGLMQYRNIVQHTNPESLGAVVEAMLDNITARVGEAQKNAEQASVAQIEDLDEAESPETMMLGLVSGEQSKDRTDRALVTPWLKFLWEAYRSLLEIMRNNVRFEALYQSVSNKAIDFCKQYERKTEFHRLCDLLRNHLQAIGKFSHHQNAVNLSNPETMQLFLDTHFHQLNTATEMELWQESFRSVEDIHSLIHQSKRPIKPQAMANYFENLTRIMYVVKNPLFLAAAWQRYYNFIHRQTKIFSEEQLQSVANNVLLSTLAVPIIKPSPRVLSTAVDNKQRTQRFTSLLFLSSPPTRVSLINDLANGDVLGRVLPELRPLYDLVEEQFHPLSICKKLGPVLSEQIATNEDVSKYGSLLCNVILTRLLQQLSQVYTSVQLDFVFRLARFPEPYAMTPAEIERFIMHGARRGEFQLRIDHQSRSVVFDTDPFDGSQSQSNGAQLQASPAELMRSQLSSLAICLSNAQRVTCPEYVAEKQVQKEAAVAAALQAMQNEHRLATARKAVIDRRKDIIENALARKERDEARERAIRIQREQEQERERIAEEQRRRELDRITRERDAIQRIEAKKLAESIKEKAGIDVSIDDLEQLDTSKLLELQVEQLEKEKHDMQSRLKTLARKADHTERAYRKCEHPMLEDDYAKQKLADRENHDNARKAQLEQSREKYVHDTTEKKRFLRMVDDFNTVRKQLDQGRSEDLAAERRRVREELARAREERVAEYRRVKAAKEEAEAVEKAEREAREAEEEKDKAAKAAETARLREEMAAQRQRDEEAMKRHVEQARELELENARAQQAASKRYVPPALRAGGAPSSGTASPASGSVPPAAAASPAAAAASPTPGRYVPPSRRAAGASATPPSTGTATPARDAALSPQPSAASPTPGKYVPPSRRNLAQ
ncbi:eukaryotic translation initiation factor 3 subunit A [Coemansia biformis]|uniref:Eukaryotic translation initiation factor 3 subunit A n=1 Tax=Coemansia biformis TaxID=1286918 RepID=A0A9W7Y8A4_9FUNG|nr:eukaryotic translation initiation factor 3 subunit A [Coemansia biformis]